jgi:hypothetical protein
VAVQASYEIGDLNAWLVRVVYRFKLTGRNF